MITIHKQLHSPDLKVIHAWIKVKQGQEKGKILDWFIFPRIVQSVWSVRDLNWDAVPFFFTQLRKCDIYYKDSQIWVGWKFAFEITVSLK